MYHVLKYELINAHIWFVFYNAFLSVWLLNFMCINIDLKVLKPSQVVFKILVKVHEEAYKLTLKGEHSNLKEVFIDRNSFFYSVGDSRMNLFENGGNDANPKISTHYKHAGYGGLKLSCHSKAFK